MAVAGLHNVSAIGSTFLRESQAPTSRRWGEQGRPSTRRSSLLHMWQELESEHVVSHPNGRCLERPQRIGSETTDSDRMSNQGSENGNGCLENDIMVGNESQSYCNSLVESENEHDDSNSYCSEQSTDLSEVERERVRRVFREWMSSGLKSHLPNSSLRNNRSRAQWLGENERERVRIIREWVQMNSQQAGTCDSPRDEGVAEVGSQIEQVRDGQLVNLFEVGERRPMRKLCGRQALLDLLKKAEMERNKELQELSTGRQVSNFPHRNRIQALLRGRFLLNQRRIQDERPSMAASELGLLRQRHTVSDLREGFLSRSDHGAVNGVLSDASSVDEHEDGRDEQSQSSSGHDVSEICNQSDPGDQTQSINGTFEDDNNNVHSVPVPDSPERGSRSGERIEVATSLDPCDLEQNMEDVATRGLEAEQLQQVSDADSTYQMHQPEELCNDNEADRRMYGSEGSATEEFTWRSTSVQEEEMQESAVEHEETTTRQLANEESEWTEVNGEDISGGLMESSTNQWSQEASDDYIGENNQMHESHSEWHENVLHDAFDSWLDVPSGVGSSSLRRVDSFYFPDGENIPNMELRELVSRRRVSTLLQSGFRESLDQLIQSYVERQNNAADDWDLDGSSLPPASIDQDQEQHDDNRDEGQPSWDLELQDDNWPDHNPQQRMGNEWDIINELRTEMMSLQQRMDSMQNMLEACMDMQVELQRSVRQEVSAALNRSLMSSDICKENMPMDETKWDHVRRGICCMCTEKNIDSLLYRCGHMCTCSKCAEELLRGGKCPMCCAPVVEAIRAYFIQ